MNLLKPPTPETEAPEEDPNSYLGADFHPEFQQIASVDIDTGDVSGTNGCSTVRKRRP
jgi:hypothetical protein